MQDIQIYVVLSSGLECVQGDFEINSGILNRVT